MSGVVIRRNDGTEVELDYVTDFSITVRTDASSVAIPGEKEPMVYTIGGTYKEVRISATIPTVEEEKLREIIDMINGEMMVSYTIESDVFGTYEGVLENITVRLIAGEMKYEVTITILVGEPMV